jgi:hypothetical protein
MQNPNLSVDAISRLQQARATGAAVLEPGCPPSVARSQANRTTLCTYRDGGTQAVVGADLQLLRFGDERPPSAAWSGVRRGRPECSNPHPGELTGVWCLGLRSLSACLVLQHAGDCESLSRLALSGGIFDCLHVVDKTRSLCCTAMNRLRNGQGPRQTPPPEVRPGSHSLDVYGYFQDAIAKLRAGFCFSAAPKMAPGERHTPCHDVIQGTCRPRRSGPLPGPSLFVA